MNLLVVTFYPRQILPVNNYTFFFFSVSLLCPTFVLFSLLQLLFFCLFHLLILASIYQLTFNIWAITERGDFYVGLNTHTCTWEFSLQIPVGATIRPDFTLTTSCSKVYVMSDQAHVWIEQEVTATEWLHWWYVTELRVLISACSYIAFRSFFDVAATSEYSWYSYQPKIIITN